MGRTTQQWTADDCERARQWIAGKARTGVIFRDQSATVDDNIESIISVADEHLQATIRDMLTDKAWSRLLNTLRQHRHNAEQTTDTATDSKANTDSDDVVESSNVAALQTRIRELEAEVSALREYCSKLEHDAIAAAINSVPIPDSIIKRLIQFCHPDKHGGCSTANELTQWLNKYRKTKKTPPAPPAWDDPEPPPDPPPADEPPADEPPADKSNTKRWRYYAVIGHKIKGAIHKPKPPPNGEFFALLDATGTRYIAVLTTDNYLAIVPVDGINNTLKTLIRAHKGDVVIKAVISLADNQQVLVTTDSRSYTATLADYSTALSSRGKRLPRGLDDPQITAIDSD